MPLSLVRTWFLPLPVCDHSQGFYFPPNTWGGLWVFGFYSNKQTKQRVRNCKHSDPLRRTTNYWMRQEKSCTVNCYFGWDCHPGLVGFQGGRRSQDNNKQTNKQFTNRLVQWKSWVFATQERKNSKGDSQSLPECSTPRILRIPTIGLQNLKNSTLNGILMIKHFEKVLFMFSI